MSSLFYQKGLDGILLATDSIRNISSSCDSSKIELLQALKVVSYAAQENHDYERQSLATNEMNSLIKEVHFKNHEIEYSTYLDINIRTANYYFNIGAYHQAHSTYAKIVDTLNKIPLLNSAAYEIKNVSLQGLGKVELKRNNFHKAAKYFQYAIDHEIEIAKTENRPPTISSIYCKLGQSTENLDSIKKANVYYKICIKEYRDFLKSSSPEKIATYAYYIIPSLRQFANNNVELGKNKIASDLFSSIDKIESNENPRIINTLLSKAKLYRATNKLDSINPYMIESKNVLQNFPSEIEFALKWKLQNIKFLKLDKKYKKALNEIEKLDAILKKLSPNLEYRKLYESKSTVQKLEILYLAKMYDQYLHELLIFQKNITRELNLSMIFQDHMRLVKEFYPILELGLELIYEKYPYKINLAYNLLECTRSLKLFQEYVFSTSQSTINDSLIVKYKLLSTQKNRLANQSIFTDSSLSIKNKLFRISLELDNAKTKISQLGVAKKSISEHQTLSSIQKKVRSNSIYQSYFSGTKNIYYINITKDSFWLNRIERIDFDNKINSFLPLLRDKFSSITDIQERGHEIYQILFSSLENLNNISSIIIAGDGVLSKLPMESLSLKNRMFLVEKYNIHYIPSIQLKMHLETDLLNRESEIKTMIFQPSFNQSNLSDLVFAEKEATAIKEITKGKKYSNLKATKSAFLKICNQFNIIHLATHADAVSEQPELSYIQFTSDSQNKEDKLYYNEINPLGLKAELICLSACKTGLGKNYNGEGMQSLARKFLASGCRSIVSTLWLASDKSISEIFISFYSTIFKGTTKSFALSEAKRNYLASNIGNSRHPYFWASIILTGSDKRIINPLSNDLQYLSIIILCLILLLFLKFKS